MRTLVISDLHLGSLLARDVLRRPAALDALTRQAAKADRLVLLGDTLELLDERPAAALAVAGEVMPVLAGALRPGASAVIVAGNHDHALVRPWLRERLRAGKTVGPAQRVPRSASPELAKLCRLLAPAKVEVRYPGVWLAPRVYATHGHYVDQHLLTAMTGRPAPPRSGVAAYERGPRIDTGALRDALAAALPAPLAGSAGTLVGGARRALIASLPLISAAPSMRGASLAWSLLLEHGITRRGAIPAIARVARELGVEADALVFGHIHRRGPLTADAPAMWRPEGGAGPRVLNTGCWVWDGALAGRGGRARPYRPGGAVILDEGRAPRCVDLLARVPDATLAGAE